MAVVVAATLFVVHHLAADETVRNRVVIYPGDYVVQAGDVDADGVWRDGVTPTRVTIYPGEVAVQKTDVVSMGRWRIDVNPASGTATATRVSEQVRAEGFENTKIEVSNYLNVTLISCTDCGTSTSTDTRTIRVEGIFDPVPLAPPTATWENPMIGWPSSPPSSGNVVAVGVPGLFDPPGAPYTNLEPFGFEFGVTVVPMSRFSVYVDVLGDIVVP